MIIIKEVRRDFGIDRIISHLRRIYIFFLMIDPTTAYLKTGGECI